MVCELNTLEQIKAAGRYPTSLPIPAAGFEEQLGAALDVS